MKLSRATGKSPQLKGWLSLSHRAEKGFLALRENGNVRKLRKNEALLLFCLILCTLKRCHQKKVLPRVLGSAVDINFSGLAQIRP